jgi:sulfite reductase (NADPH) flavoprotein alpha-component
MATLVKKERLSRPGSPKDTWHLELDVAGSAVSYTCGDSLGVYPTQDPADVATVLHNWQLEGQAPVTLPRRLLTTTLYEALLRHVSFGSPGPKLLQWLLGYVPASAHSQLPPVLQEVLPLLLAQTQPTPETQTPAALADYLAGRTLVDLCHELPCQGLPAQELVAQLRPLQPRLYSIASTPLAQPSRIALTVEVEHHSSPTGRTSLGVATGFLTQRVPVGQPCVPVFITPSHFRLPQDPSADIILIGPGTGIAPYIGFLHERELTQASGRNWLFFGNPHRAYDYLYEERLEHWRRSGHLDGLSLAFSRDQGNKVYVQHQLEIHGASVWEWLQGGAYLYVCGDAKHMAKAVEASLLSICQTYGHLDASAAQAYVQTLKQQKRYQRDVY